MLIPSFPLGSPPPPFPVVDRALRELHRQERARWRHIRDPRIDEWLWQATDPGYIQSTKGSDTSSSAPATAFGSNVTAGSVVVAGFYGGATTNTVASMASSGTAVTTTWTKIDAHTLPIDDDNAELWQAYVTSGGSLTVTATLNAGNGRLDVVEGGPCNPIPLDGHSTGYNDGSTGPGNTNPDSGSWTTDAAVKTWAVGYYGTNTGPPGLTAGSGWTSRFDAAGFRGLITRDAIAPGTSISANGTLGSAQEWTMLGASFKGLASTNAPTVDQPLRDARPFPFAPGSPHSRM